MAPPAGSLEFEMMGKRGNAKGARVALAVREKSRKVQSRKEVGPLKENVVGKVCLKRYRFAVRFFFLYVAANSIALPGTTH